MNWSFLIGPDDAQFSVPMCVSSKGFFVKSLCMYTDFFFRRFLIGADDTQFSVPMCVSVCRAFFPSLFACTQISFVGFLCIGFDLFRSFFCSFPKKLQKNYGEDPLLVSSLFACTQVSCVVFFRS